MYACQLNSITNRFAFFCLKKELSSRTELHFSIGLDLIQVNFVRFQISYINSFLIISLKISARIHKLSWIGNQTLWVLYDQASRAISTG